MSPETLQGESRPSHSAPRPRSLQATFALKRIQVSKHAKPSKKTARYFLIHLKLAHRVAGQSRPQPRSRPRASQTLFFEWQKVYFNYCARIPNQGIVRLGSWNRPTSKNLDRSMHGLIPRHFFKNLEQATNQGKQAANQGIGEQIQAIQAKHEIFTGIYLQTQ